MATNVTQTSSPPLWNTVNDDVIFGFEFKTNNILSIVTADAGAAILLTISGVFDLPPVVGGLVAVRSTNQYDGDWAVLDITEYASPYITTIKLNVPFTFSVGTLGTIANIAMPSFSFYKGYDYGELYVNELPYTQIVTLYRPTYIQSAITAATFSVNARSVVQSLFTATPWYSDTVPLENQIDFNCFNRFRLVWNGTYETTLIDVNSSITDPIFILNSMLTTKELNEKYLDGEKYLSPTYLPIVSSAGYSFATKFVNKYPTTHKFFNGIKL